MNKYILMCGGANEPTKMKWPSCGSVSETTEDKSEDKSREKKETYPAYALHRIGLHPLVTSADWECARR